MNRMTKGLAIAAAVVAMGGIGVAAVAQTAGAPGFMGGHMGPGMMGMRDGAGPRGFGDPATHLATLKTDLAIRPEQTAAWDAYAKVMQETATTMRAARGTMDPGAMQAMSLQDRQAFMASRQAQHTQAFGTIKTAAETLLPALDDAQKAKAQAELPGLAEHGRGMMAQHAGRGMMSGPPAGTPR